jgi:cytochrome c
MSLELNKIAAAILTGGVVAMGSGFVANLLVQPDPPAEPVYTVATKEGSGGGTGGDGGGQEEQAPDLATLLADASASDGEQASRACAACHSFNKGGANKVGPNLYDVMGADIASVEGFSYSNALSEKEGEWTYEKMDAWLENPSGWAQGTSMSYNGIKDPEKRADMIAYLREQSDNPPPLPEPEQQTAEAGGEGAGGDGSGGSGGDGEQMAGDQASGDQASGDQGSDQQASGEQTSDGSGEQAASEGGDSAAGDTQTAKADASGGGGLEQKVASADAQAGKSAVAVCNACHSWNKGGPNKVGPNLYNSIGSNIASVDGFNYSDALSSMEGEWTLQKMNDWLENPNDFAPGNRMTYQGVKDDQTRYDILAYMLQQSDEGGGS